MCTIRDTRTEAEKAADYNIEMSYKAEQLKQEQEQMTQQAQVGGFKVGDWVIKGFEVSVIKQMEGAVVREVSNGATTTSGNLQVAPLTLRNKQIADIAKWWYDRWYTANYPANWPDICRALEDMAQSAMNTDEGSENEKLALEKLTKFANEADVIFLQSRNASVDGVRLFGRR